MIAGAIAWECLTRVPLAVRPRRGEYAGLSADRRDVAVVRVAALAPGQFRDSRRVDFGARGGLFRWFIAYTQCLGHTTGESTSFGSAEALLAAELRSGYPGLFV